MAALDEACRELGRDPEGLVRTTGSNFAVVGASGRRWEPISGGVDEMAAAVREFRALGVGHYVCGLDPCTPKTLVRFAGVIAALDRGQRTRRDPP